MVPQRVEFAPAKVNLCLHVTGQRGDGYHLLDSLVAFAGIGDTVRLSPADQFNLRISGPMAAGLETGDSNLVLRAARALHNARHSTFHGFELKLEKNLPIASGIGGGSADAAAALRGLITLTGQGAMTPGKLSQIALSLGADVPVWVAGQPCRMSGIGENIVLLPNFPMCHMVLVNPGVCHRYPSH